LLIAGEFNLSIAEACGCLTLVEVQDIERVIMRLRGTDLF